MMKHLLTIFFALSVFYANAQCDDYAVYFEDETDTLSNHVLCANNQNEATIRLRIDTTVSTTIGASNYYIVRTQFPDGTIRRDSTRRLNHYIWTMQPGVHTVLNVEDDQGCVTDLNEEIDIKYVPAQRAILTSKGDFCAGDDHAVVTVEIIPKTDVEMTYYGSLYFNSQYRQFEFTGSKDTLHVDKPGGYNLNYIESSNCYVETGTEQAKTIVKGTFCYDLELIHPSCDDNDGGFKITNTDQSKTFTLQDPFDVGNDTVEVTGLPSGKHKYYLQGEGVHDSIKFELRKGGLEYTITEERPSCEEGNGAISVNGLSVSEEDIIWSNGETGSSIDNLYPGLYELVVLDSELVVIISVFPHGFTPLSQVVVPLALPQHLELIHPVGEHVHMPCLRLILLRTSDDCGILEENKLISTWV